MTFVHVHSKNIATPNRQPVAAYVYAGAAVHHPMHKRGRDMSAVMAYSAPVVRVIANISKQDKGR